MVDPNLLPVMIQLYDTSILLKNLNQGISFRPQGRGMVIISKGHLKLNLNEKTEICRERDILLLAPQNIYTLLELSENPEIFILSFSPEVFHKYVSLDFSRLNSFRLVQQKAREKDFVVSLDKMEFEHLLKWIHQLDYYINSNPKTEYTDDILVGLASLAGFVLTDKLARQKHTSESVNPRKEQIALSFIKLAEEYFIEEKNLKFYADYLHISVKYLSNCVKEITGLPPTKFLANFQVNKAKILLLNTEDSIEEISEKLRFTDRYAFGKFFKKHTDFTPAKFRKQYMDIDTI